MRILRLAGLLSLTLILAGALGGCGCFYQAARGEKAPPAPSATMAQKPSPSENPRQETKKESSAGQSEQTRSAGQAMMPALRDIHYDFDKYSIRPQDAEILKQNYQWFGKNPGTRVRIEGNCDERGTVEYNLVLGQKRADSARNFLVSLGVDKGLLETISYGKEKPVDPGHNEQAWEKNRRSHFVPMK